MEQELVGGRYRLDEQVGRGGMAEVWAADDTELGRRVALKLLSRDADPARFEREARAVAALAHPNICQLYDFGNAHGRPFMVLEYLAGGTLEERLLPGEAYPDDETARIAFELSGALEHAHGRGLVHRDLKPANVLFDEEGRPKIADFGIARIGDGSTLTEAGTLLGTAAYISPEQAQGLPATAASDVYSFGVILFRMLTGRLPFASESAVELARMHAQEQPPRVLEVRGAAPPALAAVADAALAKDPRRRPQDGAALVAALKGATPTSSGAPTVVAAPETAATAVISRSPRKRRALLPAAVAALILLAAAGAAVALLATRGSGSSERRAPAAKREHRSTPHAPTTAPATLDSAPTTTAQSTPTSTGPVTTAPTTAPPTTTASPPPPPPTTATVPPTTAPPPPTTVPPTATVATTAPPPPPSP